MNRSNLMKLMTTGNFKNKRDQEEVSRAIASGQIPAPKTLKIPPPQPNIKKSGKGGKSSGGLVRGMGAATKGAGKGPWA